jgi:hypothetical protein
VAEETFTLAFDDEVSGPAEAAADSVDALVKKVRTAEDAIRQITKAQQAMRGGSVQSIEAHKQLTAKVTALRERVALGTSALLKHGKTLDAVTKEEKQKAKAAAEAAKAQAALASSTKTGAEAMGLSLPTVATLTAALVGLAASAVGGVVAFVKWIAEAANARRTAALFREAALGSAQGAKDLGVQIDALAKKVSTPKEKIDELALSLSKANISGRTIVDTLKAVTQASDAMGDQVGSKLQDIITRNARGGHMGLSPQELLGTNLDFSDVAREVAIGTRMTMKEAQKALLTGAVPIEAGAAAIKRAVEKRFKEINLRKQLDIGVQAQKARENLANLTKDVDLTPFLKGIHEVLTVFDKNTIAGRGLQQIITATGKAFNELGTAGAPVVKAALTGVIVATLKTATAFFKVRNALRKAFGDRELVSGIDAATAAMTAAEVAVYTLGAGLAMSAAAAAAIAAPFVMVYDAVTELGTTVSDTYDKIVTIDWSALGVGVIDGIVNGIKSRVGVVEQEIGGLTDKIKKAFTEPLQIHSPSRVFEDYGENIGEGARRGVERKSSSVRDAVQAMAPAAPDGASSRASSGGGVPAINIPITVHADGKARGDELAASIRREVVPQILKAITKAMRDAASTGEVKT